RHGFRSPGPPREPPGRPRAPCFIVPGDKAPAHRRLAGGDPVGGSMTRSRLRPRSSRRRTIRALALAALLAPAALLSPMALFAVSAHAGPVELKTTELGRGPTIVFVHGLGASRSDWLPTARKLIGRYRVVLVDLPGHGDTALPDPFSFASAGEALDAVLAKQNPDSTVVVAHQMGGRAALAALSAHPGRA